MSGGNVLYYPLRSGGGSGTVTSVSLTGDGILFQATPGTPVTTSGTLTPVLNIQTDNVVLAGPPSGPSATPTFRALVAADIPNLSAASITSGILALAQGGNAFVHLGDMIYGGAAAAPTILAGNVTATRQFFSQTGTGSVSAAPSWGVLVAGDIPSLPASIITSGQLAVAQGGTGTATPALVAGSNITITGSWPNQTITASGGSGSVTSVGLSTDGTWMTVGSSPITGSGTITLNRTTGLTGNQVLATPSGTTGVVGLRALVAADIPGLPATIITSGVLPLIRGGNTFTAFGDMIYAGALVTATILSGNTSATKMMLSQTGNGTISAAPVWAALVAGDIPSLSASIITSGVLALARGGNTFVALGDMIYGGTAAVPTILSGQITTTKKFLSQVGTGSVSAAPIWLSLTVADIPSLPASIITSGQLPVVLGGTGTDTPGLVAGTNVTITGTWPNQTVTASGGSGSVTSVGLSTNSSFLTVASSPITTAGTITLNLTTGLTGNEVLATPDGTTGTVSLRALVAADIPNLPATIITSGQLAVAQGGTGTASPSLVAGTNITVTGAWPNQTVNASGGGGSVTSVGLSTNSSFLTVASSPITGSGTITLNLTTGLTGNHVLATPDGTTGTASLRALVVGDIPNLPATIITSGVLALANGGNTFALLGDIIYGGTSAVPTVLSGNTTTTKKYLSQTGNGTISAAPAWAQIAAADLSNGVTGTGAVVLAGTPTFTGHPVSPTLTLTGTTPTVSAGQLGLGTTSGFGNGAAVVVTSLAIGTGSGPASPDAIAGYIKMNLAGTDVWVPYSV